MIRVAIDSDVLGDLPAGVAPILMTYADLVPTRALLTELEDHHRGSEIVLFDRGLGDPLNLASIADIERGALTPGSLPGWFDRKTSSGVGFLTVYSDQNNLAAIEEILAATPYENHWRHIARLDGIWQVPGFEPLHRPALVQVVTSSMLGIHGDGSIVLNDHWHPQSRAGHTAPPELIPQGSDTAAAPPPAPELADPFPPETRPRPV